MAVYELTTFAGTTLSAATRHMMSFQDSTTVYARMGTLENGAIFDADGTAAADKVLGQVRARFLCVPTLNGSTALATETGVFEGIMGVAGTLSGKQVGASTVTKTCTARCIEVSVEEYSLDGQAALIAGNKLYAYVNVVWQKKTEWA